MNSFYFSILVVKARISRWDGCRRPEGRPAAASITVFPSDYFRIIISTVIAPPCPVRGPEAGSPRYKSEKRREKERCYSRFRFAWYRESVACFWSMYFASCLA